MSKKLAAAKHKIEQAKKLGALQMGKKIEMAEGAIDDAIACFDELYSRLESVESVLKFCDLDGLINGGEYGG